MVSVIVPAYNSETTIGRCLESLLNQTYKNIEILVINDGSTDDTQSIVECYLKDHRLQLFNEENGGVSRARNIGLDNAHGEYIIFVDADDYVEENLIELVLKHSDGMDLVFWGFSEEWLENDTKMRRVWGENNTSDIMKEDLIQLYAKCFLNSPCNKLYKRNVIREHHVFFDTSISNGEDLKFNLDYLNCMDVHGVFIDQALYHYVHSNTFSLSKQKNMDGQCILNECVRKFFEEDMGFQHSELLPVYVMMYKAMLYCLDEECRSNRFSRKERKERWKYYKEIGKFQMIFNKIKLCKNVPGKIRMEMTLLEHDFYSADLFLRRCKIKDV